MKYYGRFVSIAVSALVIFVFQAQTQPATSTATPPGAPRALQGIGPGSRPATGQPLSVRPGQQKGPVTPNIIIIMADDLGWGDLGSYGQQLIKTPHLDRLAAEGMRFTQCYAGSPAGNASRAAMFAAEHSGHGHIRGNNGTHLRGADMIIPMYLRGARKYETIAIGKWNLGGKGTPGAPFQKGFNHWHGFVDQVHANNHYPEFIWVYEPGLRGVNSHNGDVPIVANHGRRAVYSTDLLTKVALNTIRIFRPSWETGFRPFFLYLGYTAPHANPELTRKTSINGRPGMGMEVPNDYPYTQREWPRVEKRKAAMITRLDDAVGQIMAKLKQYNMEEDTVIFFTSDNGPHQEGGNDPDFFKSAGPFRGIKGSLHEGGLRVPMIVRWTGKVKANSVSEQVFPLWDVMPTILQIARIPPPREIDGISLFPTLIGVPQKQQHDYLYWESHENGTQQAILMGKWKFIQPHLIEDGEKQPSGSKPLKLFDLRQDPSETKNIAKNHPEIIKYFIRSLGPNSGKTYRRASSQDRRWMFYQPPLESKTVELYDLSQDPSESQNVALSNPEVIKKFKKILKEARTDSNLWPLPERITTRGKNISKR